MTQPIYTNVDSETWPKLRRILGVNHPARGIFVTKYTIDLKAARLLQKDKPSAWADVAQVVTRNPGKIGVEVKSVTRIHKGLIHDEFERIEEAN